MSASLTCAVLEDFQRQQKFVAEFFLALAEIGLRRQHADGVARVARRGRNRFRGRRSRARRSAVTPNCRSMAVERRAILIVIACGPARRAARSSAL